MSIILMVGPSGSGKDTIGAELQKEGIPELVSFTTRKKRKGEVDGVNYYFKPKDEINDLEIAERTTYSGNIYGLLKSEVEESLERTEDVYFISNVDGAEQIMSVYPEETIVFWLKIGLDTMEERMTLRGDTKADIQKRLEYAKEINETSKPELRDLVVLDATSTPEELSDEILNTVKERISVLTK